jgi:hypothetical protein
MCTLLNITQMLHIAVYVASMEIMLHFINVLFTFLLLVYVKSSFSTLEYAWVLVSGPGAWVSR